MHVSKRATFWCLFIKIDTLVIAKSAAVDTISILMHCTSEMHDGFDEALK